MLKKGLRFMERTFIMLKPDCVKKGLIGQVISRIEQKGFKITAMKMLSLTSLFCGSITLI